MKEKKEREKPYENKDKIKNNRLKNHFVVYLYYRRINIGDYMAKPKKKYSDLTKDEIKFIKKKLGIKKFKILMLLS